MNNTKCSKCGLVNFATAAECKRCHTALAAGDANAGGHSFGGNNDSVHGHSNSYSPNIAQAGDGQAASSNLYYRPSGAVTVIGVVAGLVGGLVAGVAAALVYAYIISYIPFVYFTFLCTLGFAIAIGASVAGLMKVGKVRNSSVCVSAAVAVALVSFYVSWAVWLAVNISGDEVSVSSLTLMQHPLLLWDVLLKVNETGAWSMFSLTFSGIALWAVWFVEALIILVGSPLLAWGILSSDLYCEPCQEWCKEDKNFVSLAAAESVELKRRVEAKDFEYLKSIGAKAEEAAMWYRLDLHKCPSCDSTNAVSVTLEKLKVDSNGKSSVETTGVMDKLLLSAAEVSQLRHIRSELTQWTRQAA